MGTRKKAPTPLGRGGGRRRDAKQAHLWQIAIVATVSTASVAFPFYVHFNPERFGPPEMQFTGQSDHRREAELELIENRKSAFLTPRMELDQVLTGTVARDRAGTDRFGRKVEKQTYPGDRGRLLIRFVTDGRALVYDGGRLEMVFIGSELSDGSTIVAIRREAAGWRLETSDKAIFSWSEDQPRLVATPD